MSNVIGSFWSGLNRGSRIALIGGAVVLVSLVIWSAFYVLHEEYKVLFSELSEGDAGAIVTQLKKTKVPYRLADAGTTIEVPAGQVHDVRLSLMSGDLPLSGGVGFEIFDKQGLGATEHSQKVAYQRALQGELARTIGTLNNVKQVRVHLVMPESTLFTRDKQAASAAVALTLRPGSNLERPQITGVQRLVAAAVPGLDPARVVITDQRGVTLSSGDASATGAGAADARLQVKQEIEEYITLKIARLLDSAFGPGQAIVSVNATLNFNATKTTIQDLLPAGGRNESGEGRVVRRRQTIGSAASDPVWAATGDSATHARSPGSSTEVEYEYGRRIDEVIAAPGAITRMSVGVIVPDKVAEEKRLKIIELVRMAAGLDEARGDAVSVQPLSLSSGDVITEPAVTPVVEARQSPTRSKLPSLADLSERSQWGVVGLVLLSVGLLALLLLLGRTGRRRALTPEDRERILGEVRRALAEESVTEARVRS